MKRLLVSLTFLTTSLSSFAQDLSDKDKLINNGAMETLRAIEADPEHENEILNNQAVDVRDLTLSLKEQGLKSTDYLNVEDGVYAYIGSNENNTLKSGGRYITLQNHKCMKAMNVINCYVIHNSVCIKDTLTLGCTL